MLSESVEDNEDTLGDVGLLTRALDDQEVLRAFCIEEDGLKPTLFNMYTNLTVLLSCRSCTDVTFIIHY